jgi:hypothetical protein
MKRFAVAGLSIIFTIVNVDASSLPSNTDDASARSTTSAAFGRMPTDQIKERLQQWLTLARIDEATTQQAMESWADRQQVEGLTSRINRSSNLSNHVVQLELAKPSTSKARDRMHSFETMCHCTTHDG